MKKGSVAHNNSHFTGKKSMHRKLRKKIVKEKCIHKNKYEKLAKAKKIIIYTDQTEKKNNLKAKVDKTVLKFIDDFLHLEKTEVESETIRKHFRAGYCYYFAEILKAAFNRGEVCWTAPFGHIVWVDQDIPYDIEGVNDSECDHYIPISYIEEGLADFKHVPSKVFNASEEYINDAINRYINDKNK